MKSIVLRGYGTQHLGVEGNRGMIIRVPKGWVTRALERVKLYSHLSCNFGSIFILKFSSYFFNLSKLVVFI
jgi:hypothetical protein